VQLLWGGEELEDEGSASKLEKMSRVEEAERGVVG
jgi:hypothetical protein